MEGREREEERDAEVCFRESKRGAERKRETRERERERERETRGRDQRDQEFR